MRACGSCISRWSSSTAAISCARAERKIVRVRVYAVGITSCYRTSRKRKQRMNTSRNEHMWFARAILCSGMCVVCSCTGFVNSTYWRAEWTARRVRAAWFQALWSRVFDARADACPAVRQYSTVDTQVTGMRMRRTLEQRHYFNR